jgi:hypothetical protein
MDSQHAFDPSKHLCKVGGGDYLEVKWRLVWLRDRHPDASIVTDLVSHSEDLAVFRATVTVPGGGSATGWGSEGPNDFRDYIEKAETKAIGRALAALGFGTQFCPDFEFGATAGRVVDTPIVFASSRGRQAANASAADGDRRIANLQQAATSRQLKFIQAIGREAHLSDEQIDDEAKRLYGCGVADLDRRGASALIEHLQQRLTGSELAS